MRIGIFTNTYSPTVNGVAKCVEYYERGLKERGHEVIVFAPASEDYDRSKDAKNVYRFQTLPNPFEPDYTIAAPYSRPVVKALRRLDFDIIHTQHPFWVGAWGSWYARLSGVPLVTTVHTDYRLFAHVIPLPEPLVEGYMRIRTTSYCNKCDLVTTPVKSMRRLLRRHGVRTPIRILPNPTPIAEFGKGHGDRVRKRLGLRAGTVVLGFVGRLSQEKNLGFLIKAAEPVLKANPKTALVLVGDGPDREKLQKQVKKSLADRIFFVGAVPHDQVADYQAAFDLFVSASVSETQCLAFNEAMAAGRPVVAVKAPGASDMIEPGRNGLLATDAEDPADLGARIAELVDDADLRLEMGEYARQWVQQFDISVVAESLEGLYLQTADLAEEEPI
jgi:glycosyltransferase involved in cell wall biosynthesis